MACSGSERPSGEMRRLEAENLALRREIGGPDSYDCKVLAATQLGDGGVLRERTEGPEAAVVGSSFVVNKDTGRIAGGVGNNATFESHTVVHTPPDNPFYIVSITHGPNKNIDFLSIRDWAQGPKKPFLLVESGSVYTGTCEQ